MVSAGNKSAVMVAQFALQRVVKMGGFERDKLKNQPP
jgi:hypothetical protein